MIHIRQEISTDKDIVYNLHCEAFGRNNEADLVNLLRKEKVFIPELSLVAVRDNKIIGHILFSEIEIIDKLENKHLSLALAPMSVSKALQKNGVGAKLIQYGLEKAKELGYHSAIVLGHEKYYPKFGFKPAIHWGIYPPIELPSQNYMAVEITKNSLHKMSGTVQYPKAFEIV